MLLYVRTKARMNFIRPDAVVHSDINDRDSQAIAALSSQHITTQNVQILTKIF